MEQLLIQIEQVQMGRKALDAPGLAKEDWWITNEIGKRLGLGWNYSASKRNI